MRLTNLFSLIPVLAVYAQDLSIAVVEQAFNNANIPRDLRINFKPTFLLEVILSQTSALPIFVHTGVQLPREETAGPPIFGLVDPKNPLGNANQGPFVVAAVDPDAPTPTDTSHAQVRHFLGGDFFARNLLMHGLGNGLLLGNTSAAISDWMQPTPTGGNHRYIFLAFKQPNGFDQQAFNFVNATTPILNWDIATFTQEVGLGDPIAGTFMMVANTNNP